MDYKVFGMRLITAMAKNKEMRESGMHQCELAEAIGVPASLISSYCSGARKPSLEHLVKIAKVLDVPTDYLLGLDNNSSTEPDIKVASKTTGLSTKAIEILRSISHPEQLGGDWGILYALNCLLEALGENENPDGYVLADIALFFEMSNIELDIATLEMIGSHYRGDPKYIERITNSALENEALNEIAKSLRWIKNRYYGGADNGKH